MKQFDVIVVGGGHAGCEAAHICAKMGAATLLVTISRAKIAELSCNPAVGGLAKGHLVKEIDALGGIMGVIADRSGIQFRMLNKSKGAAVWSPRAQVDRDLYKAEMLGELDQTKNLEIVEGKVKEILIGDNGARGVKLFSGVEHRSLCVILCAGTFLNGLMHVGMLSQQAGRIGEPPSEILSDRLGEQGFKVGRLKTGTPPRIDKATIDYQATEEQKGDAKPEPFSWRTREIRLKQVSCHITRTNAKVHNIIRNGLSRSPLFTGKIKGIGPRYCPSVEDKIMRFPDRTSHHIFLEPEGLNSSWVYVNGFSTSIPEDVQIEALNNIRGLEKAAILRPGYAIEYDFFPPTQLRFTLESKPIPDLYFAGQINGTSGYEEAAAQGLVAGINAVLKMRGNPPFSLGRHEAYIGVLVDDLITKGTDEPYRLFTSRAEYRLLLRQDNADLRLAQQAMDLGLIDEDRFRSLREREGRVKQILLWVRANSVEPGRINKALETKGSSKVSQKTRVVELLRRPGVGFSDVLPVLGNGLAELGRDQRDWFLAESEAKYEGYIERQRFEIEKTRRLDNARIPDDLDYSKLDGLLTESRQKLERIRPETVGQASRISGVTPADISILVAHLESGFAKVARTGVSRET